MRRWLVALLVLAVYPNLVLAQPERHELGRRLRLFENAWEAQTDSALKKDPAAAMNTAVMSFFSLRLGEAGRALDQGMLVLEKKTGDTSCLEARCLWLKADTLWLDASSRKLKVKLDRFYSLKNPSNAAVTVKPQWASLHAPHSTTTTGQDYALSIPGEAALDLPEKEGDYKLSLIIRCGNVEINAPFFVVSLSRSRDERLSKIQDAVKQWSSPLTTVDEVTVSLNARLLSRLARGETLETDYPADRLLKECEEAVAAITNKRPYYSTGKLGQYWLGVRTSSKNIVPLRIQTAKVEPGKKVPVVLALHGAGGSENLFFDGYGNGKIAKLAAECGWFVVAPRNSLTKPGHAETIDALARNFPEIDTSRIFVVGHSMGAAEAIREANTTPARFSAVAALGGGGSPKPVKNQEDAFRKLPFFVGVGENDFANTQAETLSQNLKKQGVGNVTFKRYAGIEHMIIVQDALPDVFKFFDSVLNRKTQE